MKLNNLLDDVQLERVDLVLSSVSKRLFTEIEYDPILQSCATYATINYLHRLSYEVAPYNPELSAYCRQKKHLLQNIVDDAKEQQCLELT